MRQSSKNCVDVDVAQLKSAPQSSLGNGAAGTDSIAAATCLGTKTQAALTEENADDPTDFLPSLLNDPGPGIPYSEVRVTTPDDADAGKTPRLTSGTMRSIEVCTIGQKGTKRIIFPGEPEPQHRSGKERILLPGDADFNTAPRTDDVTERMMFCPAHHGFVDRAFMVRWNGMWRCRECAPVSL